jgi:hypothetical protein
MRTIIGLSVLSIGLWCTSAQADRWIQAQGNSCPFVCFQAGGSPVISGFYTRNNNPYHVCRANAEGEGERAGYNLEPDWSHTCTVEWGGQEKAITPYDCRCTGG